MPGSIQRYVWKAQRRDEAIAALDESLALDAEQYYARRLRGIFLSLMGSHEQALDGSAAGRPAPARAFGRPRRTGPCVSSLR